MPQRQHIEPETTKEKHITGRIGEKGRVTLPIEIRTKYGLKEGDIVSFTETADGILISPQVLIAQKLLEQLNEMFQDTTLEELMESSRPIRHQLAKEMYGIGTDEEPDTAK